ncbi:hypothetical protein [Psychrobacter frigidicola]|uniref:hypothetical protein n=1 Tax=Psychrobacter frigidicola TaxID=45611 RepID=UPI00191A4134|nr:hypothetical protein [Psychrobacter frigidicola]
MDLTALPTQLSEHTEPNNAMPAADSSSEAQEPALDSSKAITINPNTIILAQALTDTAISWRIHNCKISKKTITQDMPLLFLYHYDSLDDSIKQAYPLTPVLLAQFNTPMTAAAAAKLIGIADDLLVSPWHVKIVGSLVIFSEALQLAVRLHWTNTGKSTQQIYTQSAKEAVTAAFKDWQFFGRIDVLYKNGKQTLVSIDEASDDDEQLITIDTSADYQYLPATHALAVIAKLEADKAELPWFETAILERIE